MILKEKCNQLKMQLLFWWRAKRSVESGVATRTQKAQFYALLRYLNLRHDESKAYAFLPSGGGGEGTAYERGGDVHRKFWIKPLKETYLGVAQAFFDP